MDRIASAKPEVKQAWGHLILVHELHLITDLPARCENLLLDEELFANTSLYGSIDSAIDPIFKKDDVKTSIRNLLQTYLTPEMINTLKKPSIFKQIFSSNNASEGETDSESGVYSSNSDDRSDALSESKKPSFFQGMITRTN